MKICAKCQAEYPDDMAYCSYCGTPLQPKVQENVCPACGKAVHAQNLRFCPYCGYSFTSSEATKPNINNNPIALKTTNKPVTTPLQPKTQENVCSACGNVIHAKNLKECPYCGAKVTYPETNKTETLGKKAKSEDNRSIPTQKNICPACGKVIHAKGLNTCPYCGQKLDSSIITKPDINKTNKPIVNKPVSTTDSGKSYSENTEKESSSQTGLTTFIIWCVGSLVLNALIHNLLLSNICLGLIPIVAFGAAKGYYQKKRILPLVVIVVLTLVTICGLLIMKSIGKEAIRNSVIPTKSGSTIQTMQTSNKETASDVLAKYRKPDMKTLLCVQKKVFANELEAEAEILPGPERAATDAAKLLSPTVNYPRIYCFTAFDTCFGKDQIYNVVIRYCLIDTITYPQKDLMDYWEAQISNSFFNNKVKDYGYPEIIHKQFNKQTNEERVIEKRMFAYKKGTGEPFFITNKEFHELSLSAEDMAFKKRKIPWQEIKNERMRKFYEFF